MKIATASVQLLALLTLLTLTQCTNTSSSDVEDSGQNITHRSPVTTIEPPTATPDTRPAGATPPESVTLTAMTTPDALTPQQSPVPVSTPDQPPPFNLSELAEQANAPIVFAGRPFYASYKGYDLFIMGLDGEIKHQLTLPDASLEDPVWSPGCSQIAFTQVTDKAKGTADIALMNNDGSVRLLSEKLGPGRHSNPAWSADGRYLAFVSYTEVEVWQIYLFSLDVEISFPLTTQGQNNDPAWSPGGQIAFVENDLDLYDEDGPMCIAEVASGESTCLAGPVDYSIANVDWCPSFPG